MNRDQHAKWIHRHKLIFCNTLNSRGEVIVGQQNEDRTSIELAVLDPETGDKLRARSIENIPVELIPRNDSLFVLEKNNSPDITYAARLSDDVLAHLWRKRINGFVRSIGLLGGRWIVGQTSETSLFVFDKIHAIDTESGSILWSIDPVQSIAGYSYSNSYLFLSDTADSVVRRYELSAGQLVDEISLPDQSQGTSPISTHNDKLFYLAAEFSVWSNRKEHWLHSRSITSEIIDWRVELSRKPLYFEVHGNIILCIATDFIEARSTVDGQLMWTYYAEYLIGRRMASAGISERDGRLYIPSMGDISDRAMLTCLELETGDVSFVCYDFPSDAMTSSHIARMSVVSDHGIYASTFKGLICIDRYINWSLSIGGPVFSKPLSVKDDEGVLLSNGNGHLSAYRTSDHSLVWSNIIAGRVLATPLSDDNSIYVPTEMGITAVGRDTGQQRWQLSVAEPVTSTPAKSGDTLLFGCRDGFFRGANSETGAELWQINTNAPIEGGAITLEQDVYFGNDAGTFFGATIQGQVRWELQVLDRINCTPVLKGNHIIFADVGGRIRCISSQSGQPVWESRMGGTARYTKLMLDRDSLVCFDDAGSVYKFDAKSGILIWQMALGQKLVGIALCAGRLFLSEQRGALVAIERDTGRVLRSFSLPSELFDSAVELDDVLYTTDRSGTVYRLLC